MQRWRDALMAVAQNAGPSHVKAIRAEPVKKPGEACEPGKHALGLGQLPLVDQVVVVDTSGSMSGASLRATGDWLGRLEYELTRTGRDFRLLVLAEPHWLATGDAGVLRRSVGSHDALDVILASAVDEPPRWLSMIRDGAEVSIVLITDDRPDEKGVEPVLERLATALSGRPGYTFHVMGGFTPEPRLVLDATDPVNHQTCWSPRGPRATAQPSGIDPGQVYQELAIATGGARASLCSAPSRLALIDVLTAAPPPRASCAWHLGAKTRLLEARAVSKRTSEYLLREYSASQCAGMHSSYLLEGQLLALCPDTCARLKDQGFEKVEVSVGCEQ